jgi:hypothetical protein
MQAKMQQDMEAYKSRPATAEPENRIKKEEDYIEFEEVK